jgi:hypothetical protein
MKVTGRKLVLSEAASRNGIAKMLELVTKGGNQQIVENRYVRRLRKKMLRKPTN